MIAAFEKATGIKVLMTRKSSGEFYAQIKAEAANPRGDIWWGGTGDPHLQAAEEGLTEMYKSPRLADLQAEWAVRSGVVEVPDRRRLRARSATATHRAGEKKGTPELKCWSDLLSPSSRARSRSPIRIRPARRTRCSRRWCS
jgi:iron(III) transport system substrate-binding protein